VEALRNRQVKNLFAVTLLSLGLPMISMGDEARRSQQGNNNAYCQDNETSWFDWSLLATHADVHRFVSMLNKRPLWRGAGAEDQHLSLDQFLRSAKREWHGVKLGQPDWSVPSHSLAFTAQAPNAERFFHVILNAYWEPLEFELPPPAQNYDGWCRWIDTSLPSPDDIVEWCAAPLVAGRTYPAGPRSVVVLFLRPRR
jgi:glycogen operon protein